MIAERNITIPNQGILIVAQREALHINPDELTEMKFELKETQDALQIAKKLLEESRLNQAILSTHLKIIVRKINEMPTPNRHLTRNKGRAWRVYSILTIEMISTRIVGTQ